MLREAPSWVLLGWGCWDGVWSLAGGGYVLFQVFIISSLGNFVACMIR